MFKLKKPTNKINWPSVLTKIGVAATEATTAAAFGIAPNIPNILREAIAAKGAKVAHSTDEIAWVWLNVTLVYALSRLAATVRPKSELTPKELAKEAHTFITETLSDLEGKELNADWMRSPGDIPFLDPLKSDLEQFIKKVSPETPVLGDLLIATFRVRMNEGAWAAQKSDTAYFKGLDEAVTSSLAIGQLRERAWDHHHKWIRWKFLAEPIFSPKKDVETPLAPLYQKLRCFWHEKKDEEGGADEPTYKTIARVADLHETVHDWLRAAQNDDPVRLISGGPGSGKSSFARAFAGEVIHQTPFKVIFLEMQLFKLELGFENGLKNYLIERHAHTAFSPNGSPRFAEDPMAGRTEDVLLIFDGVDELSVNQERAAALTLDFVKDLKAYLAMINNDASRVRALVLGRAAAFGAETHRQLTESDGQLLCAAPIRPLVLQDLTINGVQPASYDDVLAPSVAIRAHIMSDDQRSTYWRRWVKLTGEQDTISTAVTANEMEDLNAEPLLLHLLILSGFAGKRWGEALHNRNVVYRQIFSDLVDRNMQRQSVKDAGWTADLMAKGLDCFGLAAWRGGGGRLAAKKDYVAVVELHANQLIEEELINKTSGLRTIAIQSHGRQGEEDGYEFIHKSFGEYLTARALIADAKRFAGLMTPRENDESFERRSTKEIAGRWGELIGAAELTEEVVSFLQGEAHLAFNNETQVRDVKDKMTEVWSHVLKHGFPTSAVDHSNYRHAEKRQRCAESALISVLNALASVSKTKLEGNSSVKPVWPKVELIRRTFQLRRRSHSVELSTSARAMLQRLWVGNTPAIRKAAAGLNMSSMWLERAYLRGADLSRANLSGTDLRWADLSDVSLREADLRGADLRNVDLSGLDLRGANLSEANLDGADLSVANLHGATLIGAGLNEAKLVRTKLFRANLQEADLRNTQCSRVFLHLAQLHCVDFSDAIDLHQENIDAANGSKKNTLLPEYLKTPGHWDD